MATDGVPYWVQGATALAAVAGPIITYLVANKNVASALRVAQRQTNTAFQVAQKQVYATVVSSNRQKWIDGLRDDLAAFITESDAVRARLPTLKPEERAALGQPMVLLFNRMRLRLNPKEADHQRLIALMDEVLKNIQHPDTRKREDELASLGQTILKREWERVKSGD